MRSVAHGKSMPLAILAERHAPFMNLMATLLSHEKGLEAAAEKWHSRFRGSITRRKRMSGIGWVRGSNRASRCSR